ncbi:MAG: Asp-tRNA(Asn)/Glu-tRNA(Gln) amidotransferase subunit GatC [Bacteroidia bacterium]|nr:Asp-tRNA(Asn)/Glu-tRNA(Gln) amidotransferase subunit GatC [Bacteroidia bacterium]MCC7532559.1 Asp-tRNA(Asn)/Glu-tRNA(Gln) amidotransferase subunit GatC [Bacteroidia bacterium]MCZ2141413.1 Asp-tRNA(Asn)/Glu-tRNA(Gln) amidotransferase subunit GatC [Bacteroidia bacterium]
MDITNEMVDKLADLAKLNFTEAEKNELIKDLTNITAFVEKLNEINTDGVEPLIFMTDEVNVLREDKVEKPITQEEALKNAPSKDNYYFRVPKFTVK